MVEGTAPRDTPTDIRTIAPNAAPPTYYSIRNIDKADRLMVAPVHAVVNADGERVAPTVTVTTPAIEIPPGGHHELIFPLAPGSLWIWGTGGSANYQLVPPGEYKP